MICLFVLTEFINVTDTRTNTQTSHDDIGRDCIASPGKNTFYGTPVSVPLPKFCEKLLPCTKFHWNRAIGCWVVVQRKTIFKMAAICHLEFWKCTYLVIWLSSSSKCAVVYPMSSKSDDFFIELRRFYDLQYGGSLPSWILNIRIHVIMWLSPSSITEFKVRICVLNSIEIEWFFVQICPFHDFQDDSYPPSWILEVQSWVLWKAHVRLTWETISVNWLVSEIIALFVRILATDKRTDERTDSTDGQHRCIKALSLSRAAP